MAHKEVLLDNLFQEFQAEFNQAPLDEKKRIANQFILWAGDLINTLDLQNEISQAGSILEKSAAAKPSDSAGIRPNPLSDTEPRGIQAQIEGEILLKQISENMEQVFWLRDINTGQILYISPGFSLVWGYSRENLYANPSILFESVHPEDRVQVMVAEPYIGHSPINQAYRIFRSDGSIRWIFSRTFLIRDKSGDASSSFCIAQDITDQKQVEFALRKTLDRTREQFDLSRKMSLSRKPEAVLKSLMSSHEMRLAQRAALLFFENPKAGPSRGVELRAAWSSRHNPHLWLSESSLYEDPALWELPHPNRTVVIAGIESDPRISPSLRDILLDGQIQTLIIFPLIATGDWLGCLFVYYDQEHHFDHIDLRHLKVLIDQATVTLYNLQLLEVEEVSRHEAERANEIKTEFLAMITHELRTPLTSIIGFTTTLLADDVVWAPDDQRDFIYTIQQEANRLQELIDHLLVLTRLEAGMLTIVMKPHSLSEIIQDALPQLHSLTSKHILTMHLPTDLPYVFVDAKRIAQVVVNLVRNASNYAPEGSEISITASVRRGFIQINVSDQGPGIPPAEHKVVFKAFRRGQNIESLSTQGAGLGLAICKGLVEAHGGRIWIKKKSNPGATVSFSIPLVPSDNLGTSTEGER